MASHAGILPPRGDGPDRSWWDQTLPDLLTEAAAPNPDARFDAIVVDEGQDFLLPWLDALQGLMRDRESGVFWVFHDPAQAVRHADIVEELGLTQLRLYQDHRNTGEIAALAARFRADGEAVRITREQGEKVQIIEAQPSQECDALEGVLRVLRGSERVPAEHIAVLSGGSAKNSAIWARREFNGQRLENGAIKDDGSSRQLPPQQVPPEPAGSILFETIRRFKGMEREAVVLVELPEEHERLDQLMYVAITRATTHLTIIAPPSLARRLQG
jgi:superfamily I DNA/RNA helicase